MNREAAIFGAAALLIGGLLAGLGRQTVRKAVGVVPRFRACCCAKQG